MFKKLGLPLFFVVVFIGNAQDMDERDSIKETIIKRNHAFMDLYNSGNAAGIASEIFSSQAEIYPPNSPKVHGDTEMLTGFWQAVMDMGIAKAVIQTKSATLHGDVIIDTGDVSLYAADGNQIDEAKYIVIWAKENTIWKITKDIWNSKNTLEN